MEAGRERRGRGERRSNRRSNKRRVSGGEIGALEEARAPVSTCTAGLQQPPVLPAWASGAAAH